MTGNTPDKIPWAVFLCVGFSVFMATLDMSVVNVALPSIRTEFGASLSTVQWVMTVYLLVVTACLLAAGRMADILGLKRVFLAGQFLFATTSALCAFAPGVAELIAARGLQGVGAAMLMACAPAIVAATFPPGSRGRGQGLIGVTVGLGLTCGPVLGGYLVECFGWRSLFLINIPVGVAALGFGLAYLPPLRLTRKTQRFDWVGTFLFAGAITATLAAIVGAGEARGAARPLLLGMTGAMLTLLFLLRQRTAAHPLVDLKLFRSRAFTVALCSSLLFFFSGFMVVLLFPFYLTELRGMSPRKLGLMMMVPPLLMMLLSFWAGALSDRMGPRKLTGAGLAVRSAGFAIFALAGAQTPLWVLLVGLALFGGGSAFFSAPNTSSVMGAVDPENLGVAGGFVAVARNLGMSLGVGVGGALFAYFFTRAGGSSMALAGIEQTAAFLSGWRAAMTGALLSCLAAVFVSNLRPETEKPER